MLQNRYPKFIRNSVMKRLQQKKTAIQKDDDSDVKVLIPLPYIGNKGEECKLHM